MARKQTQIVVTLSDEGVQDIDRVAKDLTAKGMTIDRVLRLTGTITGSSASAAVASLKEVKGVSGASTERSAELPPSDSKLQ